MQSYSPSQPIWRARRSHTEVIFLSFLSMASARSLACSHVSVAAIHLSASLWYWDATLFASAKVMFMCRVFASVTDSCNFNSSLRRSTNCFSISSFRSGSLLPQSVCQHKCFIHMHYAVTTSKISNKFEHDSVKNLINSCHTLVFIMTLITNKKFGKIWI